MIASFFPTRFLTFSSEAHGDGAVRTRIKHAIMAALEDIEMVGHVAAPSRRDEIAVEDIVDTLATGKAYIEVAIGGDEADQNRTQIIRKTFPVVLLCHLPDNLPHGNSHDEYADELYAEVVSLLENDLDPTVGTWGGLAEQSIDMGGGGIGNDPDGMGTLVTVIYFEVVYRHTRGAMEAAR